MASSIHNNQNIKIAHWNANGLKLKWNELKEFIINHKIQIMLVNETKIPINRKYSLQSYDIIRKVRENTRGGGLLILIKNNIKYSECDNTTNFKLLKH